jgi:hypothetical protein
MVRTGNPKKIPQTKKKKIPKQFPTLWLYRLNLIAVLCFLDMNVCPKDVVTCCNHKGAHIHGILPLAATSDENLPETFWNHISPASAAKVVQEARRCRERWMVGSSEWPCSSTKVPWNTWGWVKRSSGQAAGKKLHAKAFIYTWHVICIYVKSEHVRNLSFL